MSWRKRLFLKRLAGQALNPVRARARSALGREQRHDVDGVALVLPPDHHLPYYQQRDPSYDRYAAEVLTALAPEGFTLIDVGANVGDTAVAALQTGRGVHVRAVEGSTAFLPYLRRNLAAFADRADVVDRFVGPIAGLAPSATFVVENGTGRFRARGAVDPADPSDPADPVDSDRWITPHELLADIGTDLAVWKSDVDGYDIHLLCASWDTITDRCDVLWFEFDPAGTLGDRDDVQRLADRLGASDYALRVYDNLGRPMVRLPAGAVAGQALADLADWLVRQRAGHVTIPYLDVWAARAPHEKILDVVHSYR